MVRGYYIKLHDPNNKSYLEKYSNKIKISFYTYAGDGYVNGSGALQTIVVGFDENGDAKIFSQNTPGAGFRISKKSSSGSVQTHGYKVEKIED